MARRESTPGSSPVFSFNRYGPFYRLQRWLGLLSETDLAAARRALLFVASPGFPLYCWQRCKVTR